MKPDCEKLLFREGKEGDLPPSNMFGKVIPTYVLFCEATQVGSAVMGWHGKNNVFFIEIFGPHRKKDYGTFFIKKIEEEVRKLGFNFITAYPVLDESIWLRWGYIVVTIEKDGNMLMKKNLT